VLWEDYYGDGTLSVINISRLNFLLLILTYTALLQPKYHITVPPEFMKYDIKCHVIDSLIATDTGRLLNIIYLREDIITPLTAETALALQELKNYLLGQKVQAEILQLILDYLPRGSVILMDNYRWLHARSHIRDPEHHLRRVCWDTRPFPTLLNDSSIVQ
ncbi:hypothetical protein BO79DRAFT_147704, partial [Aspergillus costaricaensis CBS 115574]